MRSDMALDVKICGLSTLETLDAALARGATHVGFVHFPPSPRHLDIPAMADLADRARGRAEIVVVVVDPDDATLDEIARGVAPDLVQLHGAETSHRVVFARETFGLRVMKALSIGSPDDVAGVAGWAGVADRLLLDARRPKGSALPGGNGVSFDWRWLAALDPSVRYMLSGGLGPDTVETALGLVAPAGIDVSSGVESAPGVKDIALIHRFFDALDRRAERAGGRATALPARQEHAP